MSLYPSLYICTRVHEKEKKETIPPSLSSYEVQVDGDVIDSVDQAVLSLRLGQ